MIVRPPGTSLTSPSLGETTTIDFRETAPAASNATMYNGRVLASLFGGLSVGIPGELRGMEEAYRRYGVLPWQRLFEPAARVADGWKVTKELEHRLDVSAPVFLFRWGR